MEKSYTRDEVILLMDQLLVEFSDHVVNDKPVLDWVEENVK